MIRIITDTSTLYSPEEGRKLNIDVAPLSVTIANKTYREYVEITAEEFYEIIKEGHFPTSSQPPIGDFLDLIKKYENDKVLIIAMADGLSGTYQSCLSAKQISNHPNLVVLNSKTLCIPHRIMVNDAIAMRDAGNSFEDIIEMIREKAETVHSFLLPQDFEYLRRGGRLTALAAKLGGLIKIQPVVTQTKDGLRLDPFGVGRNFKSAVKKVLNHLKSIGIDDTYHFCVSHAFVDNQAEQVINMIKEQFHIDRVELADLSCAFITQGGPKCLAIQVIKK